MRNIFTSRNPALKVFDKVQSEPVAIPMTIEGTINKTILLFLLTVLSATFTWKLFPVRPGLVVTLIWVGLVGGLITGFITIFSPKSARVTSIIYVLFEGLLLGGISAYYEALLSGIVWQAIFLTFAVFGVMLFLYKTKILKATSGFIKGVAIATGGVFLFYLINLGISFFGGNAVNLFAMGIWGIVIQLVIVGIAALNLILDFHFIEEGAAQGAPKYMEWYGAFGLMVTLIWLYIEILRLLLILAANRD